MSFGSSQTQLAAQLCQLAAKNDARSLRHNLQRGASVIVDVKAPDGLTPLLAAVEAGALDAARALVEYGANVNATDAAGSTPLIAAVCLRHDHLALWLLGLGAHLDVAAADNEGRTALHWALALGAEEPIIRGLMERSAASGVRDKRGNTALHIAAQENMHTYVAGMKEKGLHLNAQDEEGATALHCAVAANHHQTVSALLLHGADPNVGDCYGDRPLHVGCRHGHLECVSLLVGKGADVNCANADGNTPLDLATHHAHSTLLAMLKEKGGKAGNPIIPSKEQRTRRPREQQRPKAPQPAARHSQQQAQGGPSSVLVHPLMIAFIVVLLAALLPHILERLGRW